MIWLLLLFTVTSAFGVLEALLELVGVVLIVLHLAVEGVAGKQAAAVVTIIVLGVGVGCAVWFFNAEPDRRSPMLVDTARYAPLASEHSNPPARPRMRHGNMQRARSACGVGKAPSGVDADFWKRYRCRMPDGDVCLRWSEYTPQAMRGCPRDQVCCPPASSVEEDTSDPAGSASGVE